AYSTVHYPDQRPWCGEDKLAWKRWSPQRFFERVLSVYPPRGMARDQAVLTKLGSQTLVYDSANNFESVSVWFRKLNEILQGYDEDSVDQKEVLALLNRKIKTQGEGALNLQVRL